MREYDDEELMTTEEVANMLRLDEKTVRAMAARGEFPYYRVGRQNLYARADIGEYLKECRIMKGMEDGKN